MNVLIIGFDPNMKYRNGGVARFMEYLQRIKGLGSVNVDFLYVDFSGLKQFSIPSSIRKGIGLTMAYLKLLSYSDKLDCVHLHTSLYGQSALKFKLFLRICELKGFPVFVQIHGGRYSKLGDSKKVIWDQIFRLSTKIGVHPGPQFEELLVTEARNKLVEMANFVPDSIRIEGIKDYTIPKFLFLARVEVNKGIYETIDSFLAIRQEGIQGKLTIAGSGSELESVRRKVSQSAFKEDVEITGFLNSSQLKRVLQSCNIFVLASTHDEGFPFSFLECGINGMVPIITLNSGIPYFFTENQEYLSLDLNDPNSLIDTMRKAAINISLRKELGSNISKKVQEQFTVEKYLPILEQRYIETSQLKQKNNG